MRSNMSHQFSQVPRADIPRSSFDRTHSYKTTFDAGWIVPVYCDEVLPGDTFNLRMTSFGRLATPLHPFMDNMFLDTFFFFVPLRLLWTNFPKFFGEQNNPGDSTDFLVPTMTSTAVTGYTAGSLHDYFGLPTQVPGLVHMSLFHRAYNLIWNQWFRDQNLQNSRPVPMGDGPDNPTDFILMRRGKRHDYFTSALPWPQKGEAVPLVISGEAPVYGRPMTSSGNSDLATGYPLYQAWIKDSGPGLDLISYGRMGRQNATASPPPRMSDNPSGGQQTNWNDSQADAAQGPWGLATEAQYTAYNAAATGSDAIPPFADLTSVDSGTINDFRFAFQLQMLLENDARGGTRYIELLLVQYGVVSPDFRLQRPEYLGGGRQELTMITVPQTSETGTTEQGNLSAYALFNGGRHGFSKSFVEHGYIIGLLNVRTDLSYQQGQPRHYGRRTRYDFYFPAFAHLGEQVVYNREIYETASPSGNDALTFGYQEYGAEYRYKPSEIVGSMRSTSAASLDVWHLAQEFSALPTLSQTFIEEDVPLARVTGVNTPHEFFKTDFFADIRSARPLPVYSVPGLITRL